LQKAPAASQSAISATKHIQMMKSAGHPSDLRNRLRDRCRTASTSKSFTSKSVLQVFADARSSSTPEFFLVPPSRVLLSLVFSKPITIYCSIGSRKWNVLPRSLRFHPNLASMRLDQSLRDRQSNPIPDVFDPPAQNPRKSPDDAPERFPIPNPRAYFDTCGRGNRNRRRSCVGATFRHPPLPKMWLGY